MEQKGFEKAGSLSHIQRMMEQFYQDFVETMRRMGAHLWTDAFNVEDPIDDIDLIVFEETLESIEFDDSFEELLRRLNGKNYQFRFNFQASDAILGNVVVRLGDRWFAFGSCVNDEKTGFRVKEIWPLRYMIPRMDKMETKLAYTIPLPSP